MNLMQAACIYIPTGLLLGASIERGLALNSRMRSCSAARLTRHGAYHDHGASAPP